MNPNIAHIVYALDDRFAEILGISLVSFYENSKDMEDIVVYVLDSGITESNQTKIENITELYRISQIVWISAQNISKGAEYGS